MKHWKVGDLHECPRTAVEHYATIGCAKYAIAHGDRYFVDQAPDTGAPDMVSHPPHYTNGPKCPGCDRTIECIDITRWLPFNPGNAIKYLWRRYFGGKVGEDAIEPVRKARWYLDDEVSRLESEAKS